MSDIAIDDISAEEVRRLLGGISEMWLRRRLDPRHQQFDPDFPQPVQYAETGRRHWSRAAILAYRDRMREVTTERRHAKRLAAEIEYRGRAGG
jgi:hypothetical protein